MIEDLLTGRRDPAVDTWHVSRREAARGATEAERVGWRVFWLDGAGLRDKRGLMDRCDEEFSLPSHFGHNWDALQDCLNDLSWTPTTCGYLVVYDHWRDLEAADPQTHRTLMSVFETAAAYWRKGTTPMAVLLLDEEPVAGP
jgi:RNAse (barnase) inhibitor barstar